MSFQPILNPELPYVGEVEDGLTPGKMVKVQGKVPPESTRFAINYQLGPTLNPRDDIALHVSPRFHDGFITRNHIKSMTWGPEENEGPMWIQPGTNFEIIILCEYQCYKIAVNGRHFTEFAHRLPYSQVTHLVIDGEVEITSIFFETIPISPKPSAPISDDPEIAVGPPPPGHLYPMLYPQGLPKENISSDPNDYKNNPNNNYRYHQESEDGMGDCLDKVGLAVGGLVAAGGVAAALHAMNKNKNKNSDESSHEKSESTQNESGLGGLGALGAALASSLASNALKGDRTLHAQQGYPPQDSNMLGSILGALGGGNQSGYQQPSADPLGGTLGSILGGVLGGGSHQQYQPSGGYNSYPQNQNSQGNDLLSGIGGALFKTAMDGLSKRSHRSHQNNDDNNVHNYSAPQSSVNYGMHDGNVPQSYTSPAAPRGERLTAAEISKGLGLSDDED